MMTREVLTINQLRLSLWAADLADGHATAAVCVGIGHDHVAGQIHVCMPEDLPVPVAIGFLKEAVKRLEDLQMK